METQTMLRHVSIGLIGLAATFLSAGDLFAQGSGFSGAMLGGGGGGGGGGGSNSGGGGFGSTGLGSSMGGTNNGGGLTMMYAATLSGGFGVLGFGGANGFGSSSSMYGGRAYGSATTAGGGTGMGSGMSTGGGGSRPTSATGGGGGGANAGGGRNRGGRAGTNTATTNAQDVWFEPRIEIGFEVPETKKSAVAKTVADSMGANKPGTRFGGVQVSMAGSVAILRGTVSSANDRQLAEQIAMLDPSVTSVRNELTVTPAAKKKVALQ
jgi:BON domain-containing protein